MKHYYHCPRCTFKDWVSGESPVCRDCGVPLERRELVSADYGMTCDGKPIDISGMVTIKDLSVGNFQFQRDEDELMDVCWVRHNERLVFEFTASCFDSSKRPPESIVAELSRFIVEHGFKPVGELEWNGKNWIQKAEKYL